MSQTPLYILVEGETFAQKLANLTELHLDGVFSIAILGRGFTVYQDRCIKEVEFLPGQVTARVVGQEVYETALTEAEGELSGGCTCPYNGPCKHLAALLIYLIWEGKEADFEQL